jgi:peptidoglycan L-alanyl-D-glutamate endopeptidase CwlK
MNSQLYESIIADPKVQQMFEFDWKQAAATGLVAAGLAFGSPSGVEAKPVQTISQQMFRGVSSELASKMKQLEALAKKENIQFKVICGYRSPAEQNRLYAQGRTIPGRKVTWTKHSKHNDGKAFDIVMLKNGRADWNTSSYRRIGELGKQLGLVWGGDWKVGDFGHFEIHY